MKTMMLDFPNFQLQSKKKKTLNFTWCFSNGADDFNIPRLVLNQFRWLDFIVQSKVGYAITSQKFPVQY